MTILLDANILLRMGDQDSLQHAEAVEAIKRLDAADQECVLVPQVIYEYWVVATRPLANNGLGMTTDVADLFATRWLEDFPLLRDERGIFRHWRSLVVDYQVSGLPAHDARLVAAMFRHGLTNLLTFNTRDFKRYAAVINIFTPSDILAGEMPS